MNEPTRKNKPISNTYPEISDTNLKPKSGVEVRVSYLKFSFALVDIKTFQRIIEKFYLEMGIESSITLSERYFGSVYQLDNDISFLYVKMGFRHILTIPQEVVESLSIEQVKKYIDVGLSLHPSARVSRIDISFDDYDENLIVTRVWREYYENHNCVPDFKGREYKGDSLALNQRGSNVYIRIYDKQVESHLPYPLTRLEMEYKHSAAHKIAEGILNLETNSKICEYLFGKMLRSIDFRDRTKNQDISRCPQLGWWKEFIGSYSRLQEAKEPAISPSLWRKQYYFGKNSSKFLATLKEIYGHEKFLFLIDKLAKEGKEKLSKTDLKLIEQNKIDIVEDYSI